MAAASLSETAAAERAEAKETKEVKEAAANAAIVKEIIMNLSDMNHRENVQEKAAEN